MKAALAAIALGLGATSTQAATCGTFEEEYLLHWRSYAAEESSLSGRPTRAYAFPARGRDRTLRSEATVDFRYNEFVRRFEFGSPAVENTPAHPGGMMTISQNLLAPYESTQTEVHFPQPVNGLTLNIFDVDENADFGRSFSDHVSIIGLSRAGSPVEPDLTLPDVPAYERRALMSYHRGNGLSGNNIYPVETRDGYSSFEVSFDEPISALAVRLTGAEALGSSLSTSGNPAPQMITLAEMTFCLPE